MSFNWKNASANEILLYQCISLLLGYDKRLIEFVFDSERPKIRKRAGILREDSFFFSHGEQLLIRAALDFWSGSGQLALWEMLETWDGETWIRFIQAVKEYRRLELEEVRVAQAKKQEKTSHVNA
jgi:hypothetical protein